MVHTIFQNNLLLTDLTPTVDSNFIVYI